MSKTYHGYIETVDDALLLFEACRLCLLPLINRRLTEEERYLIESGSVFIWDETSSGVRRWTDGRSWSASRVNGPFLTYRELEPRPFSSSNSQSINSTLLRGGLIDETEWVVSESRQHRIKRNGLIKKGISLLRKDGRKMHLVAYFDPKDLVEGGLVRPVHDEHLRKVEIKLDLYPSATDKLPTPVVGGFKRAKIPTGTTPALCAPTLPTSTVSTLPTNGDSPSPEDSPFASGWKSIHRFQPYISSPNNSTFCESSQNLSKNNKSPALKRRLTRSCNATAAERGYVTPPHIEYQNQQLSEPAASFPLSILAAAACNFSKFQSNRSVQSSPRVSMIDDFRMLSHPGTPFSTAQELSLASTPSLVAEPTARVLLPPPQHLISSCSNFRASEDARIVDLFKNVV